MAAYAALVSLMQIIHQIKNHPSPPISIDIQQFESLTANVTFLQDFLERYNSPAAADSDEADPLEIRIADAAYAAEDIIESHIVDTITRDQQIDSLEETTSSSSSSGEEDGSGEGTTSSSSSGEENDSGEETTSRSSEEDSCIISLYQDLHQVIEVMNLIKKEVMEMNTENAVVHAPVASLRASSTRQNSSTMVGIRGALHEIRDQLTSDRPDCQVIPIVGMGGIGKTFLATTVYSALDIKEHFDICAWATISRQYNTQDILCELVFQATGKNKEQLSQRSEDELGLELHQYLFRRRFLIVMDDMWEIDAWEKIQRFFPDDGNRSRVLVTTRLSELSSVLNNDYSLQMKFLEETSAWELFSKTVFGEEGCPLELEGIGKKIVENCRGLPLSIIVVGGLLKQLENTQGSWESIWENLTSVVNLDNEKHCLKLLKVSYSHLPVYLKPCFLYMGVYDQDDIISVSTLIKLWVSEGILKPVNGESLETIARWFLQDLVDRNLILTDKSWLGRTGNIRYFKIHDLLRDLCLREGRKNGFYHVIGQDTPPGIHSHRRIVIPDFATYEEIFDGLQSMSLARSVISEDDDDDKVRACQHSRLLRTLNARNQVNGRDGNPRVFRFVNLRHVIVEVHSKLWINHLWNLHTLIVYSYSKRQTPVGIWKMPHLRHIEFLEYKLHLPDPPSGEADIVIMVNLQTLKGVENFRCGQEVVKRIPNVKRLLIEYDNVKGRSGSNDDHYCLSNIASFSQLASLTYSETIKEGGRTRHLHTLTFPHSIKKLTLTMSYDDDMLEKIGSLPLLQKLKMLFGSFRTGKWEIVEGQFPCLTSLTLFWCRGLKQWMAAEEESPIFPRLEHLYLARLTQLEEIPSEIGEITALQKIELLHCSDSIVKCVKDIVIEQEKLQGEEPFHVSVVVSNKFEELKSLASSKFEVEVTQYS